MSEEQKDALIDLALAAAVCIRRGVAPETIAECIAATIRLLEGADAEQH